MTAVEIQPHVIYPYGPLVDLLIARQYAHRTHRVYAVEFAYEADAEAYGVVKIGRSKTAADRMQAIVKSGKALGLEPRRFFVSPHYANAGRVERAILDDLRQDVPLFDTPTDFPCRTEWLTLLTLPFVLRLAREWQPVEDEYGHQVALRTADLRDKRAAEQSAGLVSVAS